MYYFKRNPFLIRQLFKKSLLWSIPDATHEVYLTFDDGPTPELTLSILEILDFYKAKATFFCVGENVKRFPELFNSILDKGHGVGNHTFNHLNAWKNDNYFYLENIAKAAEYIPSRVFRPPYGRINSKLIKEIKKHYQIVMWTVLSGDFDRNTNPLQCFRNATFKTKAGDIIVFHDNLKAKQNVIEALPKTLDFFLKKGIKVVALPNNKLQF